ncbi:unnamed protein product [Didymodactylos carnosus]|uniref:Hexosyltransferase n=1 Tax=Didymodactylos carnosus TaxID=1234261 RepID=A0A815EHJ7_9BILA|nr:unnamed protein product [Didymodactylos carnosus]CAF1315188.1 unnamed protein product [Didymodactylos carnosus]CAF3639569.1 unnamed protein product [Didymodactylos carnosus]CAF4156293.1 unnamed protein product [Didymodactylos carnosus]
MTFGNSHLDVIVFVVSKSSSYHIRDSIRRTWGKFDLVKQSVPTVNMKLLFMIDIDESKLKNIQLEHELFGDIVQVQLPQHYLLNSWRDMAILDWSMKYCSHAKFVFKTDDDIFVDTFLLAKFISQQTDDDIVLNSRGEPPNISDCRNVLDDSDTKSKVLYGFINSDAEVVRSKNHRILQSERYIVTQDEYPCAIYPDFLSGFGYLVSSNARDALVCTFYRDKQRFSISDVYITGILPEYLNITRKSMSNYQIGYRPNEKCEHFFRQENSLAYACAVSLHYNAYGEENKWTVFEEYNVYWQIIKSKMVQKHNKHQYR